MAYHGGLKNLFKNSLQISVLSLETTIHSTFLFFF